MVVVLVKIRKDAVYRIPKVFIVHCAVCGLSVKGMKFLPRPFHIVSVTVGDDLAGFS